MTDAVVKKCINQGSISTKGKTATNLYCAGIAAYSAGIIEESYNDAVIETSGESSTLSAAGINASSNPGKISLCVNRGDIRVEGTATSAYAAGMVGTITGTIEKSYNTGKVTLTASSSRDNLVGGISAYLNGQINECYNTGELQTNGNSKKTSIIAGIAGSNAIETSIVSNCYNIGKIIANGETDAVYTAGIVGYSPGKVINVFNLGDIHSNIIGTDRVNVGGIIVSADNTGTVYNVYSAGSITKTEISSKVNIGMISVTNASDKFSNCYYKESQYPGIYSGNDVSISKTEEEMKKTEFLELLNSNLTTDVTTTPLVKWKTGIQGYPILEI